MCNPSYPSDEKNNRPTIEYPTGKIKNMCQPISSKDLSCLPPSQPLPGLPSTRYCKWSFNYKTQVLLANFWDNMNNRFISVVPEDEKFLFQMMKRDDITVVSEGLADRINPKLYTKEFIEGCIGEEYHNKIRRVERVGERYEEQTDWYGMIFLDYFQYVNMWVETQHSCNQSRAK